MSSPSRSPSPLPSTRYFDLLPTELLRNIFNDLDEVVRTRESEVTLLSLCLTSKLFRSLAQPLLLKHIRLQLQLSFRPLTDVQKNAGQDLLKRLVENNSDESLAVVEVIIFNREKLKNVVKWLKMLIQKATNLREVYVQNEKVALKAFVGSNITKLSIFSLTLTIDYVLFFPELVYLSISGSPIYKEGGIRINLPKVRHLGFFGSIFYRQEIDFLNRLAPKLVSFSANFVDKSKIPPSILNSPSISILFKYFPTDPAALTLGDVRNLYFPLAPDSYSASPNSLPKELNELRNWTHLIENSDHQVETLTISKVIGGGGGTGQVHPDTEALLPALANACRNKGVEVIWDLRSGVNVFDDQVPPSFVERSEAKIARLEAETEEKEEGEK